MQYKQTLGQHAEPNSDYITCYLDDTDMEYTMFMYQAYGLDAALELVESYVEDYTGNIDSEL